MGERGKFNKLNKLNELTGKEWIKFTKSWFIHSPPRRKENEILHPAKFPESLAEEFIRFFTKKNQWVLDPFLGTGSALIAAANAGRNAVGVELNEKYFNISKERVEVAQPENKIIPLLGNSLNLRSLVNDNLPFNPQFDYAITSPPYWNQLKRNSMRQKKRADSGLDTIYSSEKSDIGNIDDYKEFIEMQSKIFDNVYDLLKDKAYLTVITNNIFFNGRIYPLAFDTAIALTQRGQRSWILKDEKIWLQNDKALIALGINNAWVGNRHHQYCLIFRKEKDRNV